MPRELELKFSSASGGVPEAEDLAAALAPLGLSVERREERRQDDVYFDDAAHTLAGRGLALRVRSSAGARVAAVKGRGEPVAGLFEREELEAPLDDAAWDGAGGQVAWPEPIAGRLAGLIELAALAPTIEIATRRDVFTLGRGGAEVAEIAFDEVACRPPRTGPGALIEEAAFSEVEVEALGATTAAELRAVGSALEALVPLVAGGVSKLERATVLLAPFL